jgi:catechol 2,3-dioxygenase-like lactoylglutathione lyase family enzyme
MRLFHTALSVRSIAKSRKFYETVFGLKFNNEAESSELKAKFVQLKDDLGNLVELFQHDAPLPLAENLMDFQRVGIKHISFAVANLEKVISAAVDNGGSLVRPPRAGKTVKRNAFIRDVDGIPIELVEL